MQHNSLLDMLESKAQPAPEMVAALERLRRGQEWMTITWRKWRDVYPWPADVEKRWNKSFDAWEELEQTTRRRWKLDGCVIGPQGCHPDAPINCDYCAAKRMEAQSKAAPAQALPGDSERQAPLFSVSRAHQ